MAAVGGRSYVWPPKRGCADLVKYLEDVKRQRTARHVWRQSGRPLLIGFEELEGHDVAEGQTHDETKALSLHCTERLRRPLLQKVENALQCLWRLVADVSVLRQERELITPACPEQGRLYTYRDRLDQLGEP